MTLLPALALQASRSANQGYRSDFLAKLVLAVHQEYRACQSPSAMRPGNLPPTVLAFQFPTPLAARVTHRSDSPLAGPCPVLRLFLPEPVPNRSLVWLVRRRVIRRRSLRLARRSPAPTAADRQNWLARAGRPLRQQPLAPTAAIRQSLARMALVPLAWRPVPRAVGRSLRV